MYVAVMSSYSQDQVVTAEQSEAPPCMLSFVSDLSCNIDFLSEATSALVKALLVSGSQNLKLLTPLVNLMKVHLLDLKSSLFLF